MVVNKVAWWMMHDFDNPAWWVERVGEGDAKEHEYFFGNESEADYSKYGEFFMNNGTYMKMVRVLHGALQTGATFEFWLNNDKHIMVHPDYGWILGEFPAKDGYAIAGLWAYQNENQTALCNFVVSYLRESYYLPE